jgi:DNA-binding transcriptional LysR family regulator
MELRHIRYFLAVADSKSFTRAAEQIGIGQPPLSMQIRDLEKEVGVRLFRRIPQGVELTAAGTVFLDVVRTIPSEVERAMLGAQRAARGECGSLRIGFTASAAFNPVVAECVGNFRRSYPDVSVTLKEKNTPGLVAAITEGELDVVFLRPGEIDIENLGLRLMSEEPLFAVLPRTYTSAQPENLCLADLSQESFVLFQREISPHLFDTIVAACRKAGFEPRIEQVAPQMASIMNLVAAGLGVSLLPPSMSQIQVKGVVFRALKDVSATARLSLAWRRVDTSPFVRNFLACAAS